MKTAAWLVVLAAGVAAAPAVASAETRVGIGVAAVPAQHPYRDAYSIGFERGRRDGAEEGWSDGRHRRHFDFWREDAYRKGSPGYKGWMGPKWEYADGYRRGFESGYRRSYAAASRGYRYYGDERYGYDGRDRYDRRYDDRYYDDRDRDWNR